MLMVREEIRCGREEVKGKELPHRPIRFSSSSSAVLTSLLHALLSAITQNYSHVETDSPLLAPRTLSTHTSSSSLSFLIISLPPPSSLTTLL